MVIINIIHSFNKEFYIPDWGENLPRIALNIRRRIRLQLANISREHPSGLSAH